MINPPGIVFPRPATRGRRSESGDCTCLAGKPVPPLLVFNKNLGGGRKIPENFKEMEVGELLFHLTRNMLLGAGNSNIFWNFHPVNWGNEQF